MSFKQCLGMSRIVALKGIELRSGERTTCAQRSATFLGNYGMEKWQCFGLRWGPRG